MLLNEVLSIIALLRTIQTLLYAGEVDLEEKQKWFVVIFLGKKSLTPAANKALNLRNQVG